MKPLIRVNSCLISPPSDLAFSLAFVNSSAEAFSLSVTCGCEQLCESRAGQTYVEERHLELMGGAVVS